MRTFATGFFTECSVSELISINITYTRIITLLWMIFLVWVPHLFIHLSTEKKMQVVSTWRVTTHSISMNIHIQIFV